MSEQSFGETERRKPASSWVNIVLGIWVIISPFVLGMVPKGIWNNVVVSAPVGILVILRLSMRQLGRSWLNLILGIWLVISPFTLFLGTAAMWNNVILRIIVSAFALTNTYSKVSTPIGI